MVMDRNKTTWLLFIFFFLFHLREINLHVIKENANFVRDKPKLVIITHLIALREFKSTQIMPPAPCRDNES